MVDANAHPRLYSTVRSTHWHNNSGEHDMRFCPAYPGYKLHTTCTFVRVHVYKLLQWPLEMWYMGAYLGVGACPGHCSIHVHVFRSVCIKYILKKVAFVFLQEEEENMLTILEFFKLFFMVRSFPSN